jgi:hypothetical protein
MGTPACGGKKVDGNWWYSTGAYSFGCNSKLELSANGKCAVVEVVDNGPAQWVEDKAKATCGGTGYIIDASPLVTQHLYGLSCAGWSDCKQIQVRPVPDDTPTGPCAPSNPPPPPQSDGGEPDGGVEPPPEPPTPECDPDSPDTDVRRCNDCGGQHCRQDGTWAEDCTPRPGLFPCPGSLTCNAQAWCGESDGDPPPPQPPPTPTPPSQSQPQTGQQTYPAAGDRLQGGCSALDGPPSPDDPLWGLLLVVLLLERVHRRH